LVRAVPVVDLLELPRGVQEVGLVPGPGELLDQTPWGIRGHRQQARDGVAAAMPASVPVLSWSATGAALAFWRYGKPGGPRSGGRADADRAGVGGLVRVSYEACGPLRSAGWAIPSSTLGFPPRIRLRAGLACSERCPCDCAPRARRWWPMALAASASRFLPAQSGRCGSTPNSRYRQASAFARLCSSSTPGIASC
jgi:hypothetical protein